MNICSPERRLLVHSLPRQSKKSSHSCCFTCFSGGIFAGFVSDKTKCSGITVVFMLILAAPMVSQLHNCTRERLKESFLFDFLVAMHALLRGEPKASFWRERLCCYGSCKNTPNHSYYLSPAFCYVELAKHKATLNQIYCCGIS